MGVGIAKEVNAGVHARVAAGHLHHALDFAGRGLARLPHVGGDAGDVPVADREVALVDERAAVVAVGVVRCGVKAALGRGQERCRCAGEDGDVDHGRALALARDGEVPVGDIAARRRHEVEGEGLLEGVPAGVEGLVDGLLLVEPHPRRPDVGLVAEEDEVPARMPERVVGSGLCVFWLSPKMVSKTLVTFCV